MKEVTQTQKTMHAIQLVGNVWVATPSQQNDSKAVRLQSCANFVDKIALGTLFRQKAGGLSNCFHTIEPGANGLGSGE